VNSRGAEPLAVAPFMIAGDQVHAYLQRTGAANAANPGSYAVLAIRLSSGAAPRFDYQPEADARRVQDVLHVLGGLLRAGDRVAIISPIELIVVLSGLPSPEYAELGAVGILTRLDDLVSGREARGKMRATVGIANSGPDTDRPGDLVRQARTAAREAMTTSKGYHTHRPVKRERILEGLEPALRAALAANDLHLVFQPQINLASGKPVAVEALARWNGTGGGPVTPDVFIPLAEQCGLLPSLTRWVLNSALRQHRQFIDAGLHVSMAINISPMDLREGDFCELVDQALQTWSVNPGEVTLEITETAPVHDTGDVMPLLERLKGIGVQLSIDDFGTGYSSLSLLRQLPVDEIKIDQQFVRGLLASKQKLDIVRATLDLARNFGLRTVAEGIEDEDTLHALHDLGCELGQGFGIARPVVAEEVAGWLRERTGHLATAQAGRPPPRRP